MHLKRGYILLAAGGTLIAISFAILLYYGPRIVSGIQAEANSVSPGNHLIVSEQINSSRGAYLVVISEPVQPLPTFTIQDPNNRTIATRTVDSPVVFQQFLASDPGNYTLNLVNLSNTSAIQVSATIGDQEQVFTKRIDVSAAVASVAFGFLAVAGIGVLIAGVVVTILDKRRIHKMKQYGDTSDLV